MSSILDNLAHGDVSGFNGIPEGARVSELIPDFDSGDGRWGEATLGRQHQQARFIIRDSATGRRLRVWFDADCRVLLVDFDYPGLAVPPLKMLEALGEPDEVLDSADDMFPHLKERLFAGRGLSLISDRDDSFLVRIIAFAPTTAVNYIGRLRVNP